MRELVNHLRAAKEPTHKDQTYRIPHSYGYPDENGNTVHPFNVDWVSPYSLAFGANPPNLDATVMVMAQDWTSDQNMRKDSTLAQLKQQYSNLWYTPGLPTNRRLDDLLRNQLRQNPAKVFFTNLFPYIKPGNMSAGIPVGLIRTMANLYAKPQVEIVQPKIVVCLGLATYNGLRHAYGMPELGSTKDAIDEKDGGFFTAGETQVWCQAHPGSWGWNNRNKDNPVDANGDRQVHRDWARMAGCLG
jgi:restriction system protein